jgi:hypothetical protein
MLLRAGPLIFRKRSSYRGKRGAAPTPPPVALTLVAAVYDSGNEWVRLSFNQPIDTSQLVVAAVYVDDGSIMSSLFRGMSMQVIDPATVQIDLEPIDPATGPFTTLSVAANNGIVAISGGDPWAGVNELGLPYP